MHLRCILLSKNSRNLRTFSVYIVGPKIRSFKLFDKSHVWFIESLCTVLFGATSVAALLHSLSLWHCPERVGRMWWPLSADSLLPSAGAAQVLTAQFEVFTLSCCKCDLNCDTMTCAYSKLEVIHISTLTQRTI